MMKNKHTLYIILGLLLSLIISVLYYDKSKKSSISYNNENNIVVVEISPKKVKSYFNIFDMNLNLKKKIVANNGIIGTHRQSFSINKNRLYMTVDYISSFAGQKPYDKLLVFSLDNFKKSHITLGDYSPDSLLVDNKNIYTTFNWGEGVTLYKQNKNGNIVKKVNIDPHHKGLVSRIVDLNDKIVLIYENILDRKSSFWVVSKDSLNILEKIPIKINSFPSYFDAVYKDGLLCSVGTNQDGENESILTVFDVKTKKVSNFNYNKGEFASIFDIGNKLIIFSCDNKRDENSKSTIFEFDKSKKILSAQKRIDGSIEKVIKVDGFYYAIGYNNIYKITKDYIVDKKISISKNYNSEIFNINKK